MKETQNKAILQHLNNGGVISPLQALNAFGCFRLAARIYEIRKANPELRIKSERKQGDDGKAYAIYYITKD